ncbi:MAG TPA: cysteine--tRNA ligase [Anaerolineaceae bacterium]|nr:cysteine--tRNA ligase [Anaerolineaceae bacterium]HOS53095.1 cysteine--tRNA ligase [Anaerolineaceae bacterium]HPD63207.1 cysteine--tRNA ligase [Anaerolineaceae bacterium]HQF68631.1 cysteine--tRNA ligase [Anaerolineaceae bacterium]HQK05514.1 cysteine--tRNA ligase [Anaerolineaceae bacterium]
MKVYNTLSRKVEEFQTLEPGKVKMYVCGPTVYAKAHIGHAMSALVFDIIRRYLEYRGYEVRHVMNFTDVDDKIILRAQEKGVDPFKLGEMYIHEFEKHLQDFNILPATVNPRATREMEQIITMIQGLVEKGFAYDKDGDVYFRVTSDSQYGKLSGRRIDDMQSGYRIEVDERKEHPMDFALWKAAKPGEPAWDSPWGKGRPGWHIECSAMNLNHLGEQIDIHGGGNDLVFPHHENEIAQSESYTGKTFARYWIHNGMLQLSGEKMSKSVGNLVTIEEFLENHPADALRMLVLNSGYRNPLSFSDEILAQAEKAIERLRSGLKPAPAAAPGAAQSVVDALARQVETAESGFVQSMDDDFNSAGALAQLFDLVRGINQARADGATHAQLSAAQLKLRQLTAVLGLSLEKETETHQEVDGFVNLLIEIRRELRANKLWELSDSVRDRLAALGVVLEDSKEGTSWHWK